MVQNVNSAPVENLVMEQQVKESSGLCFQKLVVC